MRTKMKALTIVLCAVLLVVSTVFVTMAFLTSTDSVKNTFTFGQVTITLDEADVDEDGVVENGGDRTSTTGRLKENKYHLIPGHTYVKDPTVHVDATSEKCWLFVKLNNGLKEIIAGQTTYSESDAENTFYTIEAQMLKNGWTCIDSTNNVWVYKEIVSASANVNVFDNFILADDADVSKYGTAVGTDADGKSIGGKTIDVTAYAVQADGFDDDEKSAKENAVAAWTASFGASAN